MSSKHRLRPLFIGIAVALGWTPCTGPILSQILTYAANGEKTGEVILTLLVFMLGFAIPFMFVTLLYALAGVRFRALNRVAPYLYKIGGVFLLFVGILLLFNKFNHFVGLIFQFLDFIGYSEITKKF